MPRFNRHVVLAFLSLVTLAPLVGGFRASASSTTAAVAFTGVSPNVIPASSDYATDVRGQGWNFDSDENYSTWLTGPGFVNRGGISSGIFGGVIASEVTKVWPQDITIPGTLPTQNEGGTRPIDTSRYRYLTFRMFSSLPRDGLVYWHKDSSFAPGTFGSTPFVPFAQGWHTYSIDLASNPPRDGTLPWARGLIQGLAIYPAQGKGVTIKVDWIRLSTTPPASAPVVTAQWRPSAGSFDLYYDTDAQGKNATLIAENVAGTAGQYRWVTPHLAPGTYYFIAKQGTSQTVSSAFVVNTPPTVTIVAPSYTSGPDYATTLVGNPWDMSGAADFQGTRNLRSAAFQDGIFSAANTSGDPQVWFNVGPAIDPTRFYYVTYRMRIHGPMNVFEGSVARVIWSPNFLMPQLVSQTRPILTYEGWRTVSIDLRGAALEPGRFSGWTESGMKTFFELDPHEFPSERRFELDDVKLTGNDRADTSFRIRYQVTDADGAPRTSSFSYFKPGAAPTPLTCKEARPASTGRHKVYLPMARSAGGAESTSQVCTWDLRSVPNGDYKLQVVTTDGYNTSSAISDTLLEVRH